MADEQFLAMHNAGVRESWGEAESPLGRFITLQPPNNRPPVDLEVLAKAPPILSFERRREVELPWREILDGVADPQRLSVHALREMLESSWSLQGQGVTEETLPGIVGGDAARLRQVGGEEQSEEPPAEPSEFVFAAIGGDGSVDQKAIVDDIIITHGSGRHYRVLAGRPLELADFATVASYNATWANDIEGLEQIYLRDQVQAEITEFAEIDLRAIAIERAMAELLERRKVAVLVATEIEGLSASVTRSMAEALLAGEETSIMHDRLISAKLAVIEIDRQLDRVVAHASALGFVVFKENAEFEFAPDDKRAVVAGEVYQAYRRTATWTTTHKHDVTYTDRVLLIFSRTRTRTVTTTRQHTKQVTDYRKVDTATDPLMVGVEQLRQSGFEVLVFDRRATGFVTPEGVGLKAVIAQCDFDEGTRRRTAVLLPVYEQRLTGRRELIKYSIFKRPLPGVMAIDLPRVSLVEQLAYRTSWQGTELGELVSGINLAPGETRTVTVSKEFTRETTTSRSTTSIFEVNSAESNELSTEMENQFSSESEEASYLDAEASVSGSYGVVSAEASAKAGTSSSMKQASQAISRIARKSAQSINRQNREEVTTSTSARTMVSTTDRTTATLRNINDGRTLNLMFYRVYNRYDSGLFLDDLKVEVLSGVEVIAGSGVLEASLVPLSNVDQLVQSIDIDQLPYALAESAAFDYRRNVLDAIVTIVEKEYAASDGKKTTGRDGESLSVALVTLPPANRLVAPSQDGPSSEIARLEAELEAAKAAERELKQAELAYKKELLDAKSRFDALTVASNEPRDEQQLRIASGSLYLEAALGVTAATEPFSEAMRVQEVRFRAAEALRVEAKAMAIRNRSAE